MPLAPQQMCYRTDLENLSFYLHAIQNLGINKIFYVLKKKTSLLYYSFIWSKIQKKQWYYEILFIYIKYFNIL